MAELYCRHYFTACFTAHAGCRAVVYHLEFSHGAGVALALCTAASRSGFLILQAATGDRYTNVSTKVGQIGDITFSQVFSGLVETVLCH